MQHASAADHQDVHGGWARLFPKARPPPAWGLRGGGGAPRWPCSPLRVVFWDILLHLGTSTDVQARPSCSGRGPGRGWVRPGDGSSLHQPGWKGPRAQDTPSLSASVTHVTVFGSADPHDPILTHKTEVYQLVRNRDQEPMGLQQIARQGCPRGKEASIHFVGELEPFTFFHSVPATRHVLGASRALAHGHVRVVLKGAH